MLTNLDRFKNDLDSLVTKGETLLLSMQYECFPKETDDSLKKRFGDKTKGIIKALPSFEENYQSWYSEAKALIRQLLPDRLADLVHHYEKPKSRKDINFENYRIDDYLQGLTITSGWEKKRSLDRALRSHNSASR